VATPQKRIVSYPRGGTICERVTVAQTPIKRMRGLLGRRSLTAGDGLLLRPERGIHTAFMRFPIDAVFLGPDMDVIEIFEDVGPWRIVHTRGAYAVLELAAGEASRRDVRRGDLLGVVDHAATDADDLDDGADVLASQFLSSMQFSTPPSVATNGAGRPPMRVLLIAHDRRFRAVASALLTRRGCAVTTSPAASRLATAVKRDQIDVVVVDAGEMLTAAARTVATIEELRPPVGVVLVADEAEIGLDHLPVLAKWGPFEDIFAAIEQAERDRGRRSRLVG
jgi:uncharacterized membrane protein (UPF0127 family)/CheY-like chemotaxis protein